MKKITQKIAMVVLTLSVVLSNVSPIRVHAETTDVSTIETIAKNTPQAILGSDKDWSDVSVEKSTPLYDFNNNLVAYSVDLKNNLNDEKAFAIISIDETDGPILEFSVGNQSPYDKVDDDNQTCIFDGILGYYSHANSNDKYTDISMNKTLKNSDVEFM